MTRVAEIDLLYVVKQLWLSGCSSCAEADEAGHLLTDDPDTRAMIDGLLPKYAELHEPCCGHKRRTT